MTVPPRKSSRQCSVRGTFLDLICFFAGRLGLKDFRHQTRSQTFVKAAVVAEPETLPSLAKHHQLSKHVRSRQGLQRFVSRSHVYDRVQAIWAGFLVGRQVCLKLCRRCDSFVFQRSPFCRRGNLPCITTGCPFQQTPFFLYITSDCRL